jgi:hypothetical protein
MELLMKSSPFPFYLVPLRPKYSPATRNSKDEDEENEQITFVE